MSEYLTTPSSAIGNHRDLLVWQKAVSLAAAIVRITSSFPSNQRYGLVTQMQKAAVSVPSNIAEGAARGRSREFLQYLRIARGSLAELESQVLVAQQAGFISHSDIDLADIQEIERMLNRLISRIQDRSRTQSGRGLER